MHAALLSPGPSISRYVPRGEFTVGVNRAAVMVPCAAWACGDPALLTSEACRVSGNPALLTSDVGLSALRSMPYAHWTGEVMTFEQLRFFLDPCPRWDHFTALAAVVYAAAKGAKVIDCYGMDWAGTADADGWDAAGNRSDDRWRLEAGIFGQLRDALAHRGVIVNRVVR